MNDKAHDAMQEQQVFCKEHDFPMFVPESGRCFSCGFMIFSDERMQQKAGEELITSCPRCKRSFVD